MVAKPRARTLPFTSVLRLAIRNIGRSRARTTLSMAAVATGVVGLILSGGFINDIIFQLGEALIHSQSGHIQIARAGYFESGTRSPGKFLISPQDSDGLRIGALSEIEQMAKRVAFSGLLGNGRSSYPIIGEGIEPALEARLGTHLVHQSGRALSTQDRYAAFVGVGVARAMGLKPGSMINVVAPTVDESMNTIDLEVVGIFQSFSKDYDDRVVKIPLPAVQELLDTNGINTIVLLLRQTEKTSSVVGRLTDELKARGLEAKTWDWLNDFYWKTVALYDRQFGVLRLIVLLMVVVAVIGAINVGIVERIGEFGTMRALGNTSSDVLRLVMAEGVLLGLGGALIGVAVGLASSSAISAIGIPMPPPPNSNLEFTAHIRVAPVGVVAACAVGLLSTIFASLPPALYVARFSIVEALRRMV